jgi:5-methylcytosine-specific restriction endonuclease McrA
MSNRKNYRHYIASDKWRNSPARLAELAASKNRCRLCPQKGDAASPLEVHHATYENMGNEALGDLIALCHACHVGVTSMLRGRRYQRSRPRRADVQCHRDTRHSFTDPTRH